ncbi:hypothetical protein [Nonomuraea sp. NPDC001699]
MPNVQARSLFPVELGRNGLLVIAARALRTFGYGCTSVLLAELLTQDGDAPWQTGLLLAVASAAFVGTISPSTSDNTPFSGVEQAILAQTCPQARHTSVFTCYNVTAMASGALGALAAAGLGLQPWTSAPDAAFALYALLAAGTVTLFWNLTPQAEPPRTAPSGQDRRSGRMCGQVRLLAGLSALDALAGGLAVQAVLAWWFAHRYGATTTQLGLVFFAANLLPALAQLTAPLLAARRGLLATMLLPHTVANLLLACIPFAPNLATAVTLLLLRQTVSKIDVPARQAFTAAVVPSAHRTAAASMTSLAHSVAVSVAPIAATTMLTGTLAALGAPLLLGAALGLGYDLALWRAYRGVPLT